jgi:hypothetical protein
MTAAAALPSTFPVDPEAFSLKALQRIGLGGLLGIQKRNSHYPAAGINIRYHKKGGEKRCGLW